MWSLVILLAFAIIVGLLSILLIVVTITSMDPGFNRVCIVVLGDIGRSPRIQYHALSFAKRGWYVDIIGYGGSTPHPDVVRNRHIRCLTMWEPPSFLKRFPKIFVYVIKVLWQCMTLLQTFMRTKKSCHILLQNPPAIPTLAMTWLVSRMRGSQLVVDWHNYGYTILALALGNTHLLVRFSKWYEHVFGQLSDANICVTKAMAEDLRNNWGISAVTMYDRPPLIFRQTDIEEQHYLFEKLSKEYPVFGNSTSNRNMTTFTEKQDDGEILHRKNRPALVVSSTSWTEDEDFSILLAALERYDKAAVQDKALPNVLCVITGKGPLKEYYMDLIHKKKLYNVQFCTPWLAAEDYPLLLGSADMGVCLHKSSSGFDLPMKVVDMFGCCLPVCAICFSCLDELVKHDDNGLIFNTEEELAQQIQDLLQGFPRKQTKLNQYRENLKDFQKTRWEDCWEENVYPIFKIN